MTHLQVQQREDIRRDLPERVKFVPPDLRVGECVFYWQKHPNKFSNGGNLEMVECGDHCCQGHHGGYQYECKQNEKTFGRTSGFA